MSMDYSNFSAAGLPIGNEDANLAYLYGLSDFFHVMFTDTSSVNLFLESSSVTASDVYSNFLQLATSISLETLAATIKSQITLVMAGSSDIFGQYSSCVYIDQNITSGRYIANRPLAPTELLEYGVDFTIELSADGRRYLQFARPITEYAFSSRGLQDGSTQYAFWVTDVEVDAGLVYSYYGKLLGVKKPVASSPNKFADFVYGLFYVYTQGPTLGVLSSGLNLVLGVPLARQAESVVDIRSYLQTDQYIVITDSSQYLLPYGLAPSVDVGDTLAVGQELAKWVEVEDYESGGEWWVNMYIPKHVIPSTPAGQTSRYATPGSTFDSLMRTYLKSHTFLLRVNLSDFKTSQEFSDLYSIARKAAPAYTQPIYVWARDVIEDVAVSDDADYYLLSQLSETPPVIARLRRNSTDPVLRDSNAFIRFNSPAYRQELTEGVRVSEDVPAVQGVAVSGYANMQGSVLGNSSEDARYISALACRNSDSWRPQRNRAVYSRSVGVKAEQRRVDQAINSSPIGASLAATIDLRPVSVPLYGLVPGLPEEYVVVPMMTLSQTELSDKLATLSLSDFSVGESYRVLGTEFTKLKNRHGYINYQPINSAKVLPASQGLAAWFPTLFSRDTALSDAYASLPEFNYENTVTESSITKNDLLALVRVNVDLVSIMWLSTANTSGDPYVVNGATYYIHPVCMVMQQELDAKLLHFGMSMFGRLEFLRFVSGPYAKSSGAILSSSTTSSVTGPQDSILSWYPLMFTRSSTLPYQYAGNTQLLRTYTPGSSDITTQDLILLARVNDSVIGVYLLSKNYGSNRTSAFYVDDELDSMSMSFTCTTLRGLGVSRSRVYGTRGYTTQQTTTYDPARGILDSDMDLSVGNFVYSDAVNSSTPRLRGGMTLAHEFSL